MKLESKLKTDHEGKNKENDEITIGMHVLRD